MDDKIRRFKIEKKSRMAPEYSLEALEKEGTFVLDTYKELGRQTIPIALAKGKIDSQRAEELQALLKRN